MLRKRRSILLPCVTLHCRLCDMGIQEVAKCHECEERAAYVGSTHKGMGVGPGPGRSHPWTNDSKTATNQQVSGVGKCWGQGHGHLLGGTTPTSVADDRRPHLLPWVCAAWSLLIQKVLTSCLSSPISLRIPTGFYIPARPLNTVIPAASEPLHMLFTLPGMFLPLCLGSTCSLSGLRVSLSFSSCIWISSFVFRLRCRSRHTHIHTIYCVPSTGLRA